MTAETNMVGGTPAVISLLRICSTAIVIGSLATVFALAFAAMTYSGPLATHLSQGIALTLIGAIVMGIAGPLTLSYRGTLVQPQDVPAILLALCAASIAARPGLSADAAFATVVVLIGLTSIVTGVAAYAMGVFRLGYLARFVPFPVVSGFLAASGAMLIRGAFEMVMPGMTFGNADWASALIEGWMRWLPWLLLAAGTIVATRWSSPGLVIPLALILSLAVFYAVTAQAGISTDMLRGMGILLGPFQGTSFATGLRPEILAGVDWNALSEQLPVVLTIVLIALLGTLLNASGLELAIGREIDFERDLKGVGLSNVAAGLTGGMVGYHTLGETFLARRFGATGISVGLGVAAVASFALLFGAEVLSYVPIGLCAAVIWYLGMDLMVTAIWQHGRRMPPVDFAIVLLTPMIALVFGFMPAVAFGIVVATLVFIVAYSGVDLARLSTTGANFHARIERVPADSARLAELGRCVRIHRLEGYVFFGSASMLVDRLQSDFRSEPRPRFAIVDLKRVVGIDVSAWAAFERLGRSCRQQGTELFITGMSPNLAARFARSERGEATVCGRSLDDVLIEIEERLLAEDRLASDPSADESQASAILPGELADMLKKYGYWMTLAAGDTLMVQGQRSDHLVFLVAGRCRATVMDRKGESRIVSRFLPGAMVGEIAFYAGVPRTATITAETQATVVRIDADGLSRMGQDDPSVAASFHRMLAVFLARRLMTTTSLLNDAEL